MKKDRAKLVTDDEFVAAYHNYYIEGKTDESVSKVLLAFEAQNAHIPTESEEGIKLLFKFGQLFRKAGATKENVLIVFNQAVKLATEHNYDDLAAQVKKEIANYE